MAGMLNIGLTGLNAAQMQLNTASHNIANAATPGYSRQTVVQSTNDPLFTGVGFFGQGTRIDTVKRQYSEYLQNNVLSADNRRAEYAVYDAQISQINNLLADATAGLSPALQNFFAGVQEVAANPNSVPARQSLLSAGQSFVARFQAMDTRLSEIRAGVESQIASSVESINGLANQIAELNQRIVIAQAAGPNVPANDLLDQRDQLLEELSGLVSITTLTQDDGSVNVFVGNGQALVTGGSAATLNTAGNGFDVTEKEIVYSVGGSAVVITDSLSGGKLGGLLRFREEILDPAQNSLGRVAVVLGTEFNAQHAQGMDLDGVLGGAFFDLGAPQVSGLSTNTGTLGVTYDSANIAELTTRDYVVSHNGTAWTLADSEGNTEVLTGAGPFNVHGLTIDVGAAVAGDRYQIRPTRSAGEDIGLAIGNVRAIAAAAPVRIGEATTATGMPVNTGDGVLRFAGVDDGFSATNVAIDLSYDVGTATFNYTGSSSGSFAYDPLTDSGTTFNIAGVNFTITGTPADGDAFTIDTNTNGTGDNSNALALAGLQTALTVENGTTNFQGAYAQMISDVGTRARQAEIGHTAQQALQRQAVSDRAAVAGVNLDEEAANLLRFQQAYQAMAQVVTVADSMFQTLLNAVRR